MKGNAHTKAVTIAELLRSNAFITGHREVLSGLPFDPDAFQEADRNGVIHAWRYERGRMFAHVFQNAIKAGRSVTGEAIAAYRMAMRRGDII